MVTQWFISLMWRRLSSKYNNVHMSNSRWQYPILTYVAANGSLFDERHLCPLRFSDRVADFCSVQPGLHLGCSHSLRGPGWVLSLFNSRVIPRKMSMWNVVSSEILRNISYSPNLRSWKVSFHDDDAVWMIGLCEPWEAFLYPYYCVPWERSYELWRWWWWQ